MPGIDRTVDIKVTAGQGLVTAEIPLAGHTSGYWRELFRKLTPGRWQELHVEAEEREDRTWVIVRLPSDRGDVRPGQVLDDVSALISQVDGIEQQSQSSASHIEATIRTWWARQQR